MLNIPESVKALFKTDGVHKNFRAHFPNGEMADITNESVVQESMHFTESICSQDVFRFGLAEASVLEFETVGVGNMYGMTIEASLEIDVSSLTPAEIAAIEAGTWDGTLDAEVANLFDEASADWSTGHFITATGAVGNSSAYKYSQAFFPLTPGKTYSCQMMKNATVSAAMTVPFYDANKNFISRAAPIASSTATGLRTGTFTAPDNAAFFRLSVPYSATLDTTDIVVTDGSIEGAFSVPLGTFRVESCPRNHGAMTHRKVTAFSIGQIKADPAGTIPGLPQELALFSSYTADIAGVLAAGTGTGLIKTGDVAFVKAAACTTLFDSAGVQYSVALKNGTGVNDYAHMVGRVWSTSSPDPITTVDFLRAGSFDAANYYAQGEAVAAALDNAGYDFTFNSSRQKIYASNKAALLANMPYLFFPVLELLASPSGVSWTPNPGGGSSVRVEPETLQGVPVTSYSGAPSLSGRLFRLRGYEVDGFHASLMCIDTGSASELRVQVGVYEGSSFQNYAVPLIYQAAPPAVELFAGTASGISLTIGSAGPLPAKSAVEYFNGTDRSVLLQMFSYVNTVDYPALVNGIYEIFGQFAKADRKGGLEAFSLSADSPAAIPPDSYEQGEVWWDEYDISPIGSVTVSFKDGNGEDTAASVVIGTGSSVYDMTDNAALANLTDASLSSLSALLVENFAPAAANVGFTPVEMTMPGWPWLEAGDALEITAEDGTVVDTYALRVEMSGIQHLTAVITAQGGEIIGEV